MKCSLVEPTMTKLWKWSNCLQTCFWDFHPISVKRRYATSAATLHSHNSVLEVDSRDLQTYNISIWRYHCLGEVVFLKIWNQYSLPSDTVHQRFCSSSLPIFKLSLQVPWIDSSYFAHYLFLCTLHIILPVGWRNSPGSGKIAPVYSTLIDT